MKKSGKYISSKELHYLEYLNREIDFSHHPYDEDMLQYEYLKVGNPLALEEAKKMFRAEEQGHLSDDPVRNMKYLFVAATTLACRYAVSGGMQHELAFNASDLYIQKMDLCQTVESITMLHLDMFTFYTSHMANIEKENVYSKPIIQSMDYIYYHLNEKIHLQDLAKYVNLNSSYLSTLFKKETGLSVSDYILKRRMEAAKNMLQYSDYTYGDISVILAFSSQSHFIQVFKKQTGLTPKEYRSKFYRK